MAAVRWCVVMTVTLSWLTIVPLDAGPVSINPAISPFGRNIRPISCKSKSGQVGTCMFAMDCTRMHGQHLGTCIDRFYFGSCCAASPELMGIFTSNQLESSSSVPSVGPVTTHQSVSSEHPNSLNDPSTTTPISTSPAVSTVPDLSTSGPTLIQLLSSSPISTLLTNPSVTTEAALTTLLANVSAVGTDSPVSEPNTTVVITNSTTITTTSTLAPATTTTTVTPTIVNQTTSAEPITTPKSTESPSTTPIATTTPVATTTTTNSPSTTTASPSVESTTSAATKPAELTGADNSSASSALPDEKPVVKPELIDFEDYTTIEPVTELPSVSLEPIIPTEVAPSSNQDLAELTTVSVIDFTTDAQSTESTREEVSSTISPVILPGILPGAQPIGKPDSQSSANQSSTVSSTQPSIEASTTVAPTRPADSSEEPVTSPEVTSQAVPVTGPVVTTQASSVTSPSASSEAPVTSSSASSEAPVTSPAVASETSPVTSPAVTSEASPVTSPAPSTDAPVTSPAITTEASPATGPAVTSEASPAVIVTSEASPVTVPAVVVTSEASPVTVPAVIVTSEASPVTVPAVVVTSEASPVTSPATSSEEIPVTSPVSNPETSPPATTQSSSSNSSVPETTTVSLPTETETSQAPILVSSSSAPESPVTDLPFVDSTSQSILNESTTASISSSTLAASNETIDGATVQFQNYREVCGRPKYQYPSARIVGGTTTHYGQWPWQISLRQWRTATFLHKCGAALLNENWAITAAHCVDNVQPDDLLLRMGEYDLATDEEEYPYVERKVQIVASHPQFDSRTFEYDLALLRFYDPVRFQPNIVPICLPPPGEVDFVGRTAYVTGWGRLYEDGPLPSKMQQVSVPVINNADCENMYRRAGYVEHIPNIFICAGYSDGKRDSCEGDSGGPMVIQQEDSWVLAGVISWGIGCAEANQPGVYTRISEFREWIDKIIVF